MPAGTLNARFVRWIETSTMAGEARLPGAMVGDVGRVALIKRNAGAHGDFAQVADNRGDRGTPAVDRIASAWRSGSPGMSAP